jgi:hydrogenase expression/formation protein HypE
VDPIFFPGGSIGDLAINGTVNDVTMCGATPLYLSVGLILEEGFPIHDFERVMGEMGRAAAKAGVVVITGDTKVVPKGAADKIFINTSGIGRIPEGIDVSSKNARVGDKIILSGTLADHGVTILTQREGLTFDAPISSDSAPLNHMVQKMFAAGGSIHTLRDPTRGGAGTASTKSPKVRKLASGSRKPRSPSGRRCLEFVNSWGSIPSTWPTRAS